MKKLLFAAHNLDLGGIETALVTLVDQLSKRGYIVTVALEKKEGVFLDRLNKNIETIEYRTSENKNIVIRKIHNLFKRIRFTLKYKNKFDFSASFATYSLASSFMARTASKNSALWGHADYLTLYYGDKNKVKKFFENVHCKRFSKIVFVSEEGKRSFLEIFPELKEKTIACNNIINGEEILKKSNQPIEYIKSKEIPVFLNVGRHDEKQKKLTRIIQAAKKLREQKYSFQVLFVGDGQDTNMYKAKVKEYGLEKNIIFLGRKENPYPYFKISDCVILSSEYEGYPVVYLESFVLNKPIITTKLSDYEQVENKRGIVVEKTSEAIYNAMKSFIENGYKIKEKFDYKKYNENILKKIEEIF